MTSVSTTGFVKPRASADPPSFSSIESRNIIARLGSEVARAWSDFAGDPRGFIQGAFSSDNPDRKRLARIRLGFICAFALHASLLAVILVVGWRNVLAPGKDRSVVHWIRSTGPALDLNPPPTQETMAGRGSNGGENRGGGGADSPRPASRGPLPQSLPQPQLVSVNPPPVEHPSLPVTPSIVGPAGEPPPPVPPGIPSGKAGDFSQGTGAGGGLGPGTGPGAGPGSGPGVGAGRGGSGARGTGGPPGGGSGAPGEYDYSELHKVPGSDSIHWIYRARAIITPEARQEKVHGVVFLRATFRSDGQFSDIEVVQPVDFMTESAIESLKRCKFKPAMVNGVPVTLRRVPVSIKVGLESADR